VGDVHLLDERTRVRTREHEAELADHAVHDRPALLLELVGEDGKHGDVTVLHCLLEVLRLRGVVEVRVGVHTLRAGLEDRVTENVLGLAVDVVVDERDLHAVLMLEGIGKDGPPVRALESSLGCPAAEVSCCDRHLTVSFRLVWGF
jgi:hypothetical protein